jgi:aminoglycoside 2'-N-acetyltransferase I
MPITDDPAPRLCRLATADLAPAEVAAIRALMGVAFGDDEEDRFTDEDWQHSIGGTHVVLDQGGRILAHAGLVEREIRIAGRRLRAGYVEAVATAPDRQGEGFGTTVMTVVGELIRDGYELGMLGSGSHHFYERLGWRTWRGPSAVRGPEGVRATPDDDGYLMVLETPSTPLPGLDLDAPVVCDWRPGDSW